MTDWRRYLGIGYTEDGCGFDGADCYGLVRLLYREELGVTLPGFDLADMIADGPAGLARASRQVQALTGRFPFEQVIQPRPLDIVVFRRGGIDDHIGLVAGRDMFLHVEAGMNSAIERWSGPEWQKRVSRFYRYCSDGQQQQVAV